MTFSVARIVAVFLLLTGATDFLRFDSKDPFASMSAAGSSGQLRHAGPHGHRFTAPPVIQPPSLPDDGCIFCGTALPGTLILTTFHLFTSEFRMDSPLASYELSADLRHPPPKPFLS